MSANDEFTSASGPPQQHPRGQEHQDAAHERVEQVVPGDRLETLREAAQARKERFGADVFRSEEPEGGEQPDSRGPCFSRRAAMPKEARAMYGASTATTAVTAASAAPNPEEEATLKTKARTAATIPIPGMLSTGGRHCGQPWPAMVRNSSEVPGGQF